MLVSWWWYAIFSAVVLFLMSWQRAHGYFDPARLEGFSFAVGSPAWQIAVSGECEGSLFGYRLDAEALLIESTGAGALLRSLEDQVRAGFALSLPCSAPVILEIPVGSSSAALEKPWLTASVSGIPRFSSANASERLTLVFPEDAAVRLDAFFPGLGDEIFLVSASAFRWADYPDRAVAAATSWGESLQLSAGTEPGWNTLVSSTLLAPTAASQVKPVPGCGSYAALSYPIDPSAGCWLADQSEINVSKYSWRGGNLFAQQPSGAYSPVALPPSDKPSQPGEIAISEIMWMGSFRVGTGLATDEWIELANLTGLRFNLRGLRIEGAAAAGGAVLVNVDLFLEPYGFVIIGRSGGANTELARDADWVTTALSLNNNGAQLVLRAQNGTELDRTPAGNWLAGVNDLSSSMRASAQRRQLKLPGIDWSNWGDCASAETCAEKGDYWRPGNRLNLGTPWQPNVLW